MCRILRHILKWILTLAAVARLGAQTAFTITTVAGSSNVGDGAAAASAILIQAEGVAADLNGNVYIADAGGHRVRKISAAGIISTVAGTGVNGFSGDGGPAVEARLGAPYGLALDARGNLYIADLSNARVRRVSTNGTIATIAGGGALPAGGVNEGSPGTAVALQSPRNVALDSAGNLYISDFDAHRVYQLAPDGFLTTFAGTGIPGATGDGGAASRAQLHFPTALAVDAQGALHIADSGNHAIRKVLRGVIATITRVGTPTGLAFDGFGVLYVADRAAGEITRLTPQGAAGALAVLARDVAFSSDGFLYAPDGAILRRVSISGEAGVAAGPGDPAAGDGADALTARLNRPAGVAADAAGNIYIADRDNNRIRRVSADGTISTLTGASAPSSVSVDANGNVLVADTGNRRVLVFTPNGLTGGIASPLLIAPSYAIASPDGTVYIADAGSGKIFKAAPGRALSVVLDGLQSPRGLALDAAGNLYFTEADAKRVSRRSPGGAVDRIADGAWNIPRGVAVAANGDLFVADTGLQRVLRVPANDPGGRATPVAGIGTPGFSGDGGAALQAELGFPWDVAIASDGSVLIADLDNNRIRRLSAVVAPPPPVTISALDVVNAASLIPGPVAPGMLIALRPAAGDTVSIGGVEAPILARDAQQIVVQAPASIAGLASVAIELRNGSNTIARADVAVAAASPGLFTSALNADGTANSSANPAARGSIVTLFGTGEGSGLPVTVSIANIAVQVLYAGPAPGYPGLLQLNVRVPSGFFNAGDVPVTFSAGNVSSQAGITIAVGN